MESEKTLSVWWGSATGRTVCTRSGVDYQIQYPGRLNGAAGPDYRGAVLHRGDRALLGDVELHVRASDWHRHEHDSDHEYDSVVLHVVFEDDCRGETMLANGVRVPVAVPQSESCSTTACHLPCAGSYAAEPARVSEILGREGIARLLGKGRRAADKQQLVGQEHALLCLVARTLGYSSNAAQCENVARHLCLPEVQALFPSCSRLERQALVLGLSGLLPSQGNTSCCHGPDDCRWYESAWRSMGLEELAMSRSEWKLGGIYPNNHPVRRMVGLADLLPGLPGVAKELGNTVACGFLNGFPLRMFEEGLRVRGDDYWRRRFDFGRATPDSDVIGRGKTREIIMNALIPLAVGMTSGDILSLARLSKIIRAYPASGRNAVTLHMRAQLGIDRVAMPAVQSQGMLRLFQTYCTRGLCEECPLGGCPEAS